MNPHLEGAPFLGRKEIILWILISPASLRPSGLHLIFQGDEALSLSFSLIPTEQSPLTEAECAGYVGWQLAQG